MTAGHFKETLIKYVISCETLPEGLLAVRKYVSVAPSGQVSSDLAHFLRFPVRWLKCCIMGFNQRLLNFA